MLDRIRRTLRAARREWKRPPFAKGGLVRPAGTRDDDRTLFTPGCDYIVPRSRTEGGSGLVKFTLTQQDKRYVWGGDYSQSSRWQG